MFKKVLIILLLVQILFLRTMPIALAQVTPTDTPAVTSTPTTTPTPTVNPSSATPTPTPTTDPSATPTTTPIPTTDPSSVTPTTTLTPTVAPNTPVTPTPTPTTDITATNSGTVTSGITSTGNSGNNTITATPSADPTNSPSDPNNPTPTGNPTATTTTGNSVAATNVDTNVNTNVVNSQFVNQTINIFATQNQNLDLTVPLNIISQLITKQNNVSPQINIQLNADNSYAVVTNNIVNTANSGGNSATAPGQVIINTGNAYSIVSLTNKVNFTIVDSVVHVITINIFGTLNGNIILPDMSHATICSSCGLTAGITNAAQVANNVDSSAISGQNSIDKTGTGSATITTGNAISVVNVDNVVNTNVIGVPIEHLYITDFGNWHGQFLSWGGFNSQPGGHSYAFNGIFPNGGSAGCPTCLATTIDINNSAKVTNNIASSANSGGNSITGGNGSITTGTAYSAVQLLNFVNANFIRTFGFFGFINIFGAWNGSIGSAGDFVTPTPTPEVLAAANTNPTACTTTGDPAITTTLSSNIGAYINPGDTALFYVHIKNTGPNDLQSEKVKLVLFANGKAIGGTVITVKKPITQGKAELVTVGLSLSPNAPGGVYTATATTDGITCDNKTGESVSSTTFQVSGSGVIGATTITPTPTGTIQTVLGSHTTVRDTQTRNWLFYALPVVLLLYLLIRGIRSRRMLAQLLRENMSIKERVSILRLLLL